ncbi:MAG: hypothetical protein FWD86_00050 [Firmicutes bacterium]|nr:hypothetical protein [Bacillota bacterium]
MYWATFAVLVAAAVVISVFSFGAGTAPAGLGLLGAKKGLGAILFGLAYKGTTAAVTGFVINGTMGAVEKQSKASRQAKNRKITLRLNSFISNPCAKTKKPPSLSKKCDRGFAFLKYVPLSMLAFLINQFKYFKRL